MSLQVKVNVSGAFSTAHTARPGLLEDSAKPDRKAAQALLAAGLLDVKLHTPALAVLAERQDLPLGIMEGP